MLCIVAKHISLSLSLVFSLRTFRIIQNNVLRNSHNVYRKELHGYNMWQYSSQCNEPTNQPTNITNQSNQQKTRKQNSRFVLWNSHKQRSQQWKNIITFKPSAESYKTTANISPFTSFIYILYPSIPIPPSFQIMCPYSSQNYLPLVTAIK